MLAPDQIARLRAQLAAWYGTHQRRLPWRDRPEPYRVWVSEIMLQQTQVATVLPYFERFVLAFPDVRAVAAAGEAEVLARWAGLGYYRRARMLHRAAREMVARFDGQVPASVDALRTLPGVGRYTAGAVASIAYGQPASVLDGNVQRVLSRLVALEEPADAPRGTRQLWALADALLDPRDPATHNQALMELGALTCTQSRPACEACPLHGGCAARERGAQESFPRKLPRRPPRPMEAACALLTGASGSILLARRPPEGLLGGLWELPGGDAARGAPADAALLSRALEERLGVAAAVGAPICQVEHAFTHRRLTLTVYQARVDSDPGIVRHYTSWRWIRPRDRALVPLSRLTEKVFEALGLAGE